MKSELRVGGIALLVACVSGSSASGQDLESRWAGFRAGDRCSIVIAVMGEPTAMIESSTLGVPHTRIRWVVGSRSYVAVCVVDRLISKRACHGSVPDC